eukprot:CAMPEP_0184658970 /NCGR_PEP_ID=MMETSP0308-20130426/27601_1 /TAXON_ID=38269 /ORGANISM="Gloeochaete witrockiana, Strain SAG 46.84" /LENGTH=272 /DNA_ID=CAMNT_0027098371 /DNA_START=500 /DNA_END=1318 /DNA_ORIENTATION=-
MIPGVSSLESLSMSISFIGDADDLSMLLRHQIHQQGLVPSELYAIMLQSLTSLGALAAVAFSLQGYPSEAVIISLVCKPFAVLLVCKLLYPDDASNAPLKDAPSDENCFGINVIDAAANGALRGLSVMGHLIGILIAFEGLMAALDVVFKLMGTSMLQVLGFPLRPVGWLAGLSWEETSYLTRLAAKGIIIHPVASWKAFSSLEERTSRGSLVGAVFLCGGTHLAFAGVVGRAIGKMVQGVGMRSANQVSYRHVAASMCASYIATCLVSMAL